MVDSCHWAGYDQPRAHPCQVACSTSHSSGLADWVVCSPHPDIPDVSTTQLSTVFVPLGTNVSLLCDYDAVPEPEVTWCYEGGELEGLTSGSRSELVLTALREDESGVYTCTASNLLGQDSVNIMVAVQGGTVNMLTPVMYLL